MSEDSTVLDFEPLPPEIHALWRRALYSRDRKAMSLAIATSNAVRHARQEYSDAEDFFGTDESLQRMFDGLLRLNLDGEPPSERLAELAALQLVVGALQLDDVRLAQLARFTGLIIGPRLIPLLDDALDSACDDPQFSLIQGLMEELQVLDSPASVTTQAT